MWGLDNADPRTAIAAMQAMNASVRNAVFAPAFFGTTPVLFLTALSLWLSNRPKAAALFALSGLVYLFGGMGLTLTINVPMNEALASITVPDSKEEAFAIWQDYSPKWQVWNQIRTIASGASLVLAACALKLNI